MVGPFGCPEFPPTGAGVPLQPCIQLSAYLIAMLGCVLPLLMARPLAQQQQQQQQETQEQTGEAGRLWHAFTQQQLPMRLVLASSFAWSFGTVAALLLGS